jgi:hypothetical protein
MLLFALIGLCLILLGIVGLQFTYMFYVDRMYNERRKHMHDLEHRSGKLAEQLEDAHRRIAEQSELLKNARLNEEEAWADLIDDR